MLTQEIAVPLWILVILIMVSSFAVIEWIVLPTFRWYVRRRANKALAEISSHLRIQVRPFQLTKKQVIADRLLHDPQVMAAIDIHAKENNTPREKSLALAKKYVWETVPSFNAYIYQRCSYWFAKKVSWHLYRVRGRVLDTEKLMNVDPEATIVFVLNHRSNMDYILVSYLASQSTTISYAVGEWAKFWPLKSLIQSMGAFFVHRNSRNVLYRKVLERYVHMATEEGVCQAVFPEGGLTKDGKMRPAKLGFIDYMLRSYDIQNKRDIVFVPVGINFDRTIEDRSLIRKLDPKAPNRSPWFIISTTIHFLFKNSLLRSTAERWKRFGYSGVNFGNPISLKEYCDKHNVYFNQLEKEARFVEVGKLAEHLMESIARVIPILPVPLIATVLLDNDKGLSNFDIKMKVHNLIDLLQKNGAPIRNKEKPKESTIDHAINMLFMRKLILEENGIYVINKEEKQLIEYYANSISHFRSSS